MDTATVREFSEILQAVERFADNANKRRIKKVAAITPKDELALRIKKVMLDRGLTQRQVSARLGITVSILNFKINGKSEFSLKEAFLLAEILKIPFDDLYFKYPY